MPLHIQRGLGLIGFGLLLGFVGLIQIANIFGVVDEHARQMAKSRLTGWMSGKDQTPAEVRSDGAFTLGRYIVGIGFMLVGLLAIGGGVVYLIAPPAE
ncbi:hypothetical protein AB0F68_31510 [Micromonospora sp. NPDC023966]|uniref:hypothetical protein n=1 Tax=Micromonospora sp. NPDC023966 TaxID=3154699 RepID=UPI00340B655C